MIADYEARTGRILQPAQVERLLINAFAYRELLLRESVQEAATQNLVDFASAPFLDYLGALVGVSRLDESAATVTIEFTLVAGHGGVIIPQGLRVASVDGRAVFATSVAQVVPAGINQAFVDCTALSTGTGGNGYAIGTITSILDPQPFLSAASNTTVSGGGAAQENDEELRERIKLAPASFSVAGPRGAYKFYALSASPSIIDVAVIGPNDGVSGVGPGEVHVFPLMEDGSVTPPTIITAVDAALNDERVRPLTDAVFVTSPTRDDYDIEVEIIAYDTADTVVLQQQITDNLTAFALDRRQTLGRDILITQIIAQCMVAGQTYDCTVIQPVADLVENPFSFGYCNSITVTITGTNNG